MKTLLTALAALMLCTGAYAQKTTTKHKEGSHSNAPGKVDMNKDHVMMMDGKMMMMHGGQMMPMDKEMKMGNGCMVKPDGTVKMKNGKSIKMKNGDVMDMDGNLGKRPMHGGMNSDM